MEACARGAELSLSVNGKELLKVRDDTFAYGMFGCGSLSMGRTEFGSFRIRTGHYMGWGG